MTKDDNLVSAVASDPDTAELSPRRRAMVDYALKLTRAPASMNESDLASLRDSGLTDSGIHDLASVVAYFNFVNRMALGLGVDLEPEYESND